MNVWAWTGACVFVAAGMLAARAYLGADWPSGAVLAYLHVLAAASVVCFATYGWDKLRAAHDGRRVSERALLLLGFIGGWPGALAARGVFRHKTVKASFRAWLWVSIVVHVAIVGVGAYLVMSR